MSLFFHCLLLVALLLDWPPFARVLPLSSCSFSACTVKQIILFASSAALRRLGLSIANPRG